jgi:GNAT superfamily N-acetyltransferase
VEIRELNIDELAGLLELYKYLHEQDEPIDPKIADSVWREICSSSCHYCLGAFTQGLLVGSCMLQILPNLTRGGRSYAIIENVVTHRSLRRKGIGSRLLKQAIDLAWAANCYKVMLLTGRKEEAVHRFYESVGFNSTDKTAFIIKR